MTPLTFDLSIVIVNLSSWGLLSACLESIERTAEALSHEIWVVDNGSTDDSKTNLKSSFPAVHGIENSSNCGFARANNQAIAHCTGRYVLLLNNDTVVHEDALRSLVLALDAHPQFAAVGPQLHNDDGSIQASCMNAPSRWQGVRNYLRALRGGSGKYVPSLTANLIPVDAVTGACLLIRREALDNVGLLDEGYFMYAEEADWCYRARQVGWKIGYVPGAHVTHYGGQTAQREPGRFYVERRISRVRFRLKHYGYPSAWWDALLIRANIWIRWLVRPSQRSFYRAVKVDFGRRLNELFGR